MGIKCPKCHFDNPDDTVYCGKCATPLPSSKEIPVTETLETPTEELTTGSTFAGRYQIIEELGKGGMGKVYKAHDTKINEKIALKLIKPEIASDKRTTERFSNELKFARKIRHKNVCQMFDLNEEKGTHYITMEYVRGEDLKRLTRRIGQLSTGQAIPIAKQACEGLAEAHRLGVVHRDLKPQNIMVDDEGNARIMDFGIARSLKAKGITGAGVMIGTPEYMSPEQVEGKEADQRSDIYSLGVILYEMVTGHVPFEGDTPFTIGVKHKSEIPKDPKDLNAQIPEDLSRVILRCLEKVKEKRYQSATEVHSELSNIEKGIPTTDRVIPKRKPITSREITVTFGLKKFFIPALLFIVLIIVGVIIWQLLPQKDAAPISPIKPSIAVLPFTDLSPQKDQEYFCNGLAESLINALSKVKDLRVPAMTSTVSFKGEERDMREIGEELNVNTVLRGSVQKAGNRLRITTQLINVADESLLWSEQYNREFNDLFSIQDEISFAIVDKLKVNLLGEERAGLLKRYTENIEAFNLYLKGRYFWNKRTEEGLKKAIEYFEEALEVDPDYALAYAGLADSYVLLPYYSSFPPKEAYLRAKESALKAVEIDNTLAEAHTSLAEVKTILGWDWEEAEIEFRRAVELNPGYAIGHHWFSNYLLYMGRFDEALNEIKIALNLDPLSLIINRDLGELFFYSRQYDKAIEQYQKTIEINPDFIYTHLNLGVAYLQKSLYDEALAEFQREPSKIWIGIAYALMGKKNEAKQVLNELKEQSKQTYVSPYLLAMLHFSLGENDRGFEMLNIAYEEHNSWLMYLYVEPLFDSVRSDPRFAELLKKIGFKK